MTTHCTNCGGLVPGLSQNFGYPWAKCACATQSPAPQPEAEAQPFTYEGSHTAADGTVTHVSGEAQKPALQAEAAEPVKVCTHHSWGATNWCAKCGASFPTFDENERAAFESAAGETFGAALTLARTAAGDYSERFADWAWHGWQARAALVAPLPPQRQEAAQVEADDFVGKRLRLVCKLAGVPIPDGNDKQIADCAFVLLGMIRAALERANAALGTAFGLTLAEIADSKHGSPAALDTPPAPSRVAAPTMQAVKVPLTEAELNDIARQVHLSYRGRAQP